jgi:hypothetical protein
MGSQCGRAILSIDQEYASSRCLGLRARQRESRLLVSLGEPLGQSISASGIPLLRS